MTNPTNAQILSALAAADALPRDFGLVSYLAGDGERYDRALDVLAAIGWLPDPIDETKVDVIGDFEEIRLGSGICLSSPCGHKPFTSAATAATPIERLGAASVTVRVGGAEVEITGPNAEAIAGAVFNAFPDASGSPLPSPDGSSDAEIIPFPTHGRGRQVAPQTEGA